VPGFRPEPRLSRARRTVLESNSASRTVHRRTVSRVAYLERIAAPKPLVVRDPPKLLTYPLRVCESSRLFPSLFARQFPNRFATPRRCFPMGLSEPVLTLVRTASASPLSVSLVNLRPRLIRQNLKVSAARHRLAGRRFPAGAYRFRGSLPTRGLLFRKAKRTWSFLVKALPRAAAHACILMQPGDSVAPRNNP